MACSSFQQCTSFKSAPADVRWEHFTSGVWDSHTPTSRGIVYGLIHRIPQICVQCELHPYSTNPLCGPGQPHPLLFEGAKGPDKSRHWRSFPSTLFWKPENSPSTAGAPAAHWNASHPDILPIRIPRFSEPGPQARALASPGRT